MNHMTKNADDYVIQMRSESSFEGLMRQQQLMLQQQAAAQQRLLAMAAFQAVSQAPQGGVMLPGALPFVFPSGSSPSSLNICCFRIHHDVFCRLLV